MNGTLPKPGRNSLGAELPHLFRPERIGNQESPLFVTGIRNARKYLKTLTRSPL
jgi:hypothetical protein